MNPEFEVKVLALSSILDELDYYQILEVTPNDSQGQVQKAYHLMARTFHPDRYFHLPDSEFKQGIYKISKRVTEAYVTLRDPQKRAFYNQQLTQSERKVLRYTEESQQAQKKAKEEDLGKTPKGRDLYRQGAMALKRKKWADAERAFKMALVYEPDNETFKQAHAEAEQHIKTDYVVK